MDALRFGPYTRRIGERWGVWPTKDGGLMLSCLRPDGREKRSVEMDDRSVLPKAVEVINEIVAEHRWAVEPVTVEQVEAALDG